MPIDLDWKKEHADVPPEGIYFGEVTDAEEKRSNAGDQYIAIKFKDVRGGGYLLQDIAMLEGGGAPIGYKKLRALGHDKTTLDPARDLTGKRAYLACVHDEYDGIKRLKVNIKHKGSTVGYWPEDRPPEGMEISVSSGEPVGDEETPF